MILPKYDERCGWYEVLNDGYLFNHEIKARKFDVVIVGAGFLGVAAARRLAENNPNKSILLLEALKIGQGASGRNSGIIVNLPHKQELNLSSTSIKNKIIRLNNVAIDYLEKQIERYSIDCQWSKVGKYHAAVGARGNKLLNRYEKVLQQTKAPYKRVGAEQMHETFATSYYSNAIFTPAGILLQPAALIRGLAASLPKNVCIAESSPVLAMKANLHGHEIKLQGQSIQARDVILATNIFTPELGFMKSRIIPVMTFAGMTAPLTDQQMQRYGGRLNWGLTPADQSATTVRMTQDGRFIVRSFYRYAYDYNTPANILPRIKEKLRQSFMLRYPQLPDVDFKYIWGGASSFSANGKAFFGQLKQGLYTACCDQCVGVVRATIAGMMLADMSCNKKSDLLQDMHAISGQPSLLPPKLLCRIGVPMRMKWERFFGRAEV